MEMDIHHIHPHPTNLGGYPSKSIHIQSISITGVGFPQSLWSRANQRPPLLKSRLKSHPDTSLTLANIFGEILAKYCMPCLMQVNATQVGLLQAVEQRMEVEKLV
jgi:hypothetical protein